MRVLASASVLVSVMSGCATMRVGAFTVWAKTWERDSQAVKQRASVELTCPAEQLQLTILAVHVSGDAEKIGVDGCGNHGVYDRSEGGWVPSSKDKGAR